MDWSAVSWPWFIAMVLGVLVIFVVGAWRERQLSERERKGWEQ